MTAFRGESPKIRRETPLFQAQSIIREDFSKEISGFCQDLGQYLGEGRLTRCFAIRGEPDDFLPSIQSDSRTCILLPLCIHPLLSPRLGAFPGQVLGREGHDCRSRHHQQSRSF